MQTFDITDGTVSFYGKEELSVGAQRRIAKATRHIPRGVIQAANQADDDGSTESETDLMGFPTHFDDADLQASWEFNDALLLAYLASWTIDRPLPKTGEDLEALPATLYGELNQLIAKVIKPGEPDPFTVDSVEDEASPTGA